MSEDIKILSTKRVSHERGRLGNMNMPIEVNKQPDGSYRATVRGQEAVMNATGATESDAVFAIKQVVKQKMQGDALNQFTQRMV